MVDYNDFSSTFANSRKGMKWPEIEYFIEDLKRKYPPVKGESIPQTGTEGGLQNIINPPYPPCQGGVLGILDVGCGSGRLFGELQKFGIELNYLGIDASSGMIDEARKAYPDGKFQVLDMNNLDTIDAKYDAIFFIASFHHLESQKERIQVLCNAKNLLKPEGKIYMTNWNLLSEENMQKYSEGYRGCGDFDIKIGSHKRYYHGFTLEELERVAKEVGLKTLENRVFEGGRNIITYFV